MPQLHRQPASSYGAARYQRWALNLGATAGSLCLLFAVVTLVLGLKPLVFASGSMAPAIPTGSLALAVPMQRAQVQPGQVVSVITSEGTRVTHRVESNAAGTGLVLKGDANPVADLQPYAVDSVDRVLFSIPVLGFVVAWFSQPWLFFVAGVLCAALIYLAFIRKQSGPPAAGRNEPDVVAVAAKRGRRSAAPGRSTRGRRVAARSTRNRRVARLGSAAVMLTTMGLTAGLGINTHVASTEAAFSGSAVANAAVKTVTATPPQGVTCRQGDNEHTIRFDWMAAPPGVTKYVVTAHLNGNTSAPSSIELPADTLSYSTKIENKSDLLGSLLSSLLFYDRTFTVGISAKYGAWQSTPVSFSSVHATAGIIGINKKLTCPPLPD